jgi:hypothetical protein
VECQWIYAGGERLAARFNKWGRLCLSNLLPK